jgi:protein phosphatase
VSIRFALRCDPGRERENNEDCARAEAEHGLFLIADGMGGHLGGEVASKLAVETVIDVLRLNAEPVRGEQFRDRLRDAIYAAHAAVSRRAEELGLYGMGTTLTVLRIDGRSATIGHVGDSRASLVVDGALHPLTRDHTIVAMLVEHGSLSPEEAMYHPERHVLTQAVGPGGAPETELVQLKLPAGARVLLSTDGLHDVVPADVIAQLAAIPDLDDAATRLIERANAMGGPDNVSVILVEP